MQILDNVRNTVKEDLQVTIKKGSKISVAAACFSIYAFKELKKQLEAVDELRFIFTSPTFLKEKTPKASREFYISRLNRERSIYGTEFEVKLRNELTQKAIAKECADWIRKKVKFKSNTTGEQMMGFMTVDETSYMPFNAFTTVDLGCERGNNAYYFVQKSDEPVIVRQLFNTFEEIWNDNKKLQDVTGLVVESISAAYNENAPDFIYFFMLYNLFNEFLEDTSEDVLPNDATGFKNSKIWNLLAATDPNGQLSLDIVTSKKGSKQDAIVYYSISFDALETGVKITKQLTPFDKRVYIAAAALFNGGNRIISANQIYRMMGNRGNPNADDLQKINDSLTKMGAARVYLDNEQEVQVNKKYTRFKYDASLLPFERISAYINGQLVESAIHLFREPPLITFARERGQITGLTRQLLESPISKTDANLQLEDYLLERIGHMKSPKSKAPRKMLYSTIYERCGITTKKQKQRAPEKNRKPREFKTVSALSYYQYCDKHMLFSKDSCKPFNKLAALSRGLLTRP